MNILGVGPEELIVVFIIMLVVAGPKRMIQWAYIAGKYTAQLRAMFQDTIAAFQKELADSGVDIPKDLANVSRYDLLGEVTKALNEGSTPQKPSSPVQTPTETAQTGEKPEESRYDSWLPK